MAAASKKKSTKENDEVKDNAKNAESVFESNTKKGGRTGSSNVKKTVRPQSTASKTLDRKRKTADVNITHQRKIQDVTEYRDRLAFETGITLIVIGIVAVFLYISFLGLGGIIGRIFGGLCFGIFGWIAWFVPAGMMLTYIFTIVNKGDRRVKRKMTGIIGMFLCFAAITDLITKKEVITEYYTSNHVLHRGYFDCMNLTLEDVLESGKSSGGLIGRWISSLLSKICGNVGACILLFALLILCLFVFEGVEIMAALRKRNAYREEMERLYGEVRDEIGYSEPSYNVLRNKSSINPFGDINKKNDEVDIREKYRRTSEGAAKKSDRPDYVENIRNSTDGVMQSVDLKMMGKFFDEQKKKAEAKEKQHNEMCEIHSEKPGVQKKKTKIQKETETKIDLNKQKSTNNTEKKAEKEIEIRIDSDKEIEKQKKEVSLDSESIPIYREEMNQKFGRNRGRLSYSGNSNSNLNSKQNNEQKQESFEDRPVPAFEEEYIPEIEHYDDKSAKDTAVENNSNIAENSSNAVERYDTYVENIAAAEENASETVEFTAQTEKVDGAVEFAAEADTEDGIPGFDTETEMAGETVEVPEINKNDEFFADESIKYAQNTEFENEPDNVSSNVASQPVKSTVETVGNVGTVNSYKKPENSSRHGKFGGEDYVSESKAFNALNETKVAEPVIERAHVFPTVELLGEPVHSSDSISDGELRETAQKLEDTLKSFNVNVRMGAVICGPTVTRYELYPEQGVRVNKITNLTDDIKLSLAAQSIRIEAPIPGKSAVGIEVPNPTPSSVYFRELLEGEAFEKAKSPLTFAVGKDISGKPILTDIGKMPHLLIAGATGSGKSVCINTLIMSILYKADPKDVKLIMIDPKVVELSVYNGIPHLMCPVVTDAKDAAATLNWAVREMSDRYNKFTELGVRNIAGYNEKLQKVSEPEKAGHTKMPYIVVIVDEFADLMMVASKDVEDAVCRLAQLARAAGIHLVLATQRPSVNVITGTIKANIPSRIAFSVSSAIDSRTILDRSGAEKLLGKGDMLFFPSGYSEPVRVQGAFVTDEEVSKIVDFLKNNNEEPEYNDKVTQVVEEDTIETQKESKPERDEYFEEAGRFVIESDRAAAGQLQRRFSIGFNRAGRIIDQLHKAGVVGPAEGTKPRKILMSKNEFEMMLGNAPEPVSEEEIDAITEEFGQQ